MNDDVSLPEEFRRAGTADSTSAEQLLARAACGTLHDANHLIRLELDDLREDNRRLRASAQQMRAEIMRLSRALEPMHRISEALETLRFSMNSSGRTASGEADLQAVHTQLDKLSLRLDATYKSTSWRLTRPVRALSRLLRRQRGADWPSL